MVVKPVLVEKTARHSALVNLKFWKKRGCRQTAGVFMDPTQLRCLTTENGGTFMVCSTRKVPSGVFRLMLPADTENLLNLQVFNCPESLNYEECTNDSCPHKEDCLLCQTPEEIEIC